MALDLKRVPTERELRRAGQMGGALTPTSATGLADSPNFTQYVDTELKRLGIARGLDARVEDVQDQALAERLQTGQAKVERARDISLSFGRGIQEWNQHHYTKAAGMFREHIDRYPDSPWAAEALLHLGCDSKYNGRFNEAASYYDTVLRNSEEDKKDPTWDVHQKAKLRWADLDIAEGKFSNAQDKLDNILKTETDWRRKTWAMHWVVNVNQYKHNARQLRACGTQALASVLVSLGRPREAARVAKILPRNSEGFSLDEIVNLARKNGVGTRGFRSTPDNLAHLPLPLIIHYDFQRTMTSWHVPQPVVNGGFTSGKLPSSHRTPHQSQWPFVLRPYSSSTTASTSATAGHFLVVRKVNSQSRTVSLFDPQEQRPYILTYAQLSRQWSGTGLLLVRRDARKLQIAQAQKRLVWLSSGEMHRVIGGCCGVPRKQIGLGNGPFNIHRGSNNPCGAPTWSVNAVSLNLFVEDTPIWYTPAVGPAVAIKLSYNSQDATNQNTIFGNKWAFNYGSYLVVDTGANGGVVTLFMPDGRQDTYTPDGSGNYISPIGVTSKLVHVAGTHWTLTTSAGDGFVYDSPAGTGSMQPFLVAQTDRWGQSVTLHYNSSVQPDQITDAQGRVTTITYNNNRAVRVDDPFGRHAFFGYDANGNLIKAVDMEGNVFGYSYDAIVRMTQIATPRGNYSFLHEGPDSDFSAANIYPAPGAPMWANVRLTITDPLSKSEEFFYYAGDGSLSNGVYGPRSWFVDKDNYQPYLSTTQNNNMPTVPKAQFVIGQTIAGIGYITSCSPPNSALLPTQISYDTSTGLPTNSTDEHYRSWNLTYNGAQSVTSATSSVYGSASLGYAANNVDVTSGTNAAGTQVFSVAYNAYHQPTSVSIDPNNTLGFQSGMSATYTTWGAIASLTDEQNHVTTCTYDPTSKLLSTIARDGVVLHTYSYDPIGRVRTDTDVNNLSTTYDYNDLNKVTKVTYADGSFSSFDYICCGLVSRTRDRAGRITYYDYDQLKRLTRVQDPENGVSLFYYDANGNLVRSVDSKGDSTRAVYDSLGRVRQCLYHDGSSDTYSYDPANYATSHTDSRGHTTIVQFNARRQIISSSNGDPSENVSYTYNALGQLQSRTDQSGTTAYTYDTLGRVATVDGPFANDTLAYTYDIKDRVHTRTINGASLTTYEYDGYSRLASVTSAAGTWTFSYDGPTSLLTSIARPDGSVTNYGRDALKRLTGINSKTGGNANIVSYAYGYDLNRNLRTAVDRQYGTDPTQHVNCSYNPQSNELWSETSTETPTPQLDKHYVYDLQGNLTQSSARGTNGVTTASYTANTLNQLTSATYTPPTGNPSARSLGFDFDGDLTQIVSNADQSATRYFYDSQSRLKRVEQVDGSGVNTRATTWTYDSIGRPVVTDEYTWDTTNTVWVLQGEKRRVFEGLRVIQERDGNNTVIADDTVAGNVGGLLARTTAAGTCFYHYDGNANVVALTDTTGATVARYAYDAFGNTIATSGAQANTNPFRFASKECNDATGLYSFGLRFYSPGLNRWISRDAHGGSNPYLYCANDPLDGVDYDGQDVRGTLTGTWNSATTWMTDRRTDFANGVDNLRVGADTVINGDPHAGRPRKPNAGLVFALFLDGAYDPADPCKHVNWQKVDKWQRWGSMYEFVANVAMLGEGGTAEEAMQGGAGETAAEEDVAANAAGGGCFVAGTQIVMADGSLKPIEQVKANDQVISKDEKTGNIGKAKVQFTTVRNGIATRSLTFADGSQIETTDEHPFYVEKSGFIHAKAVCIGTSIVTRAGPALKLVQNQATGRTATVYNLTVAGTHSYFVGKQQIWVHNTDPLDCPQEILVYRHIHAPSENYPGSQEMFDDAVDGRAVPRGGHSDPYLHNAGDTNSIFTSWSTRRSFAFDRWNRFGGVVLQDTVSPSDIVASPDKWGENEVLREGIVEGATPYVKRP